MKKLLLTLVLASLSTPALALTDGSSPEARYEIASESVNRNIAAANLLKLCHVRSERWLVTIHHGAWLMLGTYEARLRREARDPAAFDAYITAQARPRGLPFPSREACLEAVERDLPRLDEIYDMLRYK